MNTTSTPGCQPGATATRQSATLTARMRAMKMAMGSARFTSTPSRASGRCCAPGCARTAVSRRTNCRGISVSSRSCTTPAAAARLCLALSSVASSDEASHHPGCRKERSLIVFASCSGGRAFSGGWDSDRELTGLSVAHLHAGCGAAVAASRPLPDAPTLVLLEAFLRRILKGADVTTSLTEAQSEMANSATPYRHPHFWGYLG